MAEPAVIAMIIVDVPIVLVIGSGATAWLFSQSALGSYQMLPTGVGYGLIVLLILIGVIIWLTN